MPEIGSIPTLVRLGVYAERGTPNRAGELFYATDTQLLYQANGDSSTNDWVAVGAGGGLPSGTARGQLLATDADASFGIFASGTNGQYLRVNTSAVRGLEWGSPGNKAGAKVAGQNGVWNATSTGQNVFWDNETYDDSAFWSNANRDRFYMPATNRYRLTANVRLAFSSVSITSYVELRFWIYDGINLVTRHTLDLQPLVSTTSFLNLKGTWEGSIPSGYNVFFSVFRSSGNGSATVDRSADDWWAIISEV
jgi:hypothetical protein